MTRSRHVSQPKINNIISPNNFLTLNGDSFRLVGIANHTGSSRTNGHCHSLITEGNHWSLCNDELVRTVYNYSYNSDNYMFLYIWEERNGPVHQANTTDLTCQGSTTQLENISFNFPIFLVSQPLSDSRN